MKVCPCCQLELEFNQFHKNKNKKDGLFHYCIACAKIKRKEWVSTHQDEYKSQNKVNYNKNKEYNKKCRQEKPDKSRAACQRWAATHRENVLARSRKRKASKLRATVAWADDKKILAFYVDAQRRTVEAGIPYHVDHIVPLVSPYVCGLHVEHNLQVITARQNLSKKNAFTPGFQSW